jgi:hypothetical protein
MESASNGVGAAGEFTDRLVDAELSPDVGKVKVIGDLVTDGQLVSPDRMWIG